MDVFCFFRLSALSLDNDFSFFFADLELLCVSSLGFCCVLEFCDDLHRLSKLRCCCSRHEVVLQLTKCGCVVIMLSFKIFVGHHSPAVPGLALTLFVRRRIFR